MTHSESIHRDKAGMPDYILHPLLASMLFLAISVTSIVHAKDNTQYTAALGFQGHHGIGFQQHQDPLAGPDALLSAKFAASSNLEIAGLVGLAFSERSLGLTFGAKALYILVPEENLNVYVTAAAYPTVGNLGLHRADWFVGPGLAWYLPNAPNLEVFAEFGFGGTIPLTSEREPKVVAPRPLYISTTGTAILGLHYWF